MISIRHLTKKRANRLILSDINLDIEKGDVISVIGYSGSGKSTLLRCINLLDKVDDGQIFIDGIDMLDKDTDIYAMRKRIGMVFQSYNLFSHKMAIENVMMGPVDLLGADRQQAYDEAVEYMKLVGLKEEIYSYPDELSAGQQQRVAIARCLAMKPDIILFDEPTSSLDTTMVREVQSVIQKLADDDLTMMIVSHDLKFLHDISDKVLFMDEGIIYEEGTPDQIFNNPQKAKTKAFIKLLRTFEFKISSKDFDFYSMNAQVENFAKYNFMTARQLNNILLVLEELILNQIIAHTSDILIRVSYFDKDELIEISLEYGGEQLNPFCDDYEEDALSMLLLRQITKDVEYEYKNKNNIKMKLL